MAKLTRRLQSLPDSEPRTSPDGEQSDEAAGPLLESVFQGLFPSNRTSPLGLMAMELLQTLTKSASRERARGRG